MSEEFLLRTFQVRETYLRKMGKVDEFLLAPLINPAEIGGPVWPSFRQAWRTVRNGRGIIIVSDGLSDPFEAQERLNTGFGIEVLGETTDPLPEQLQASWLFAVVYAVSQEAAAHGGFRSLIDEMGVLSMEIKAPEGLQSLANQEGKIGVLLGLQSPELPTEWELPAGLVKVVTVKVLQPMELAYVVAKYEAGREQLRQLFAADGSHHLSSLFRPSVV